MTSCPQCQRDGWSVPQATTLVHHVRPELWPRLRPVLEHAVPARFCPHPGCPVVYYHRQLGLVILDAEVRTRIGYKVAEAPSPACYCVGVLAETIREEIVVRGCCDSVEDIRRHTSARTGKLCHVTNPSGRCCGSLVQRAVEAALSERSGAIAQAAREAASAIPSE